MGVQKDHIQNTITGAFDKPYNTSVDRQNQIRSKNFNLIFLESAIMDMGIKNIQQNFLGDKESYQ